MSAEKRYAAFLILAASILLMFFIGSLRLSSSASGRPAAEKEAVKTVSAKPASPAKEEPLKAVSFPGFPVDINTATRTDLMMLPGIGTKTAGRILEKRTELGGFRAVADLLQVKYISEAKLDNIRNLITIRPSGINASTKNPPSAH